MRPAWRLLLSLTLVGCKERESVPTTAAPDEARTSTAPQEGPASTGAMSEAEFAALHRHTGEAAPAPRGSAVKLGDGEAYLSLPEDAEAPLPGVLVIHEWWGLNDHIRQFADRLAAEGYAALAVDLYGGEVATKPEDAMALMKAVDPEEAKTTLAAGLELLRTRAGIRAPRTASIGWCFGGGWSLRAALLDPELDGAVMYYGRPVTEASALEPMKARLLGIFGEEDTSIPAEKLDAFRAALEEAGVEHRILTYPAPHAFANPSSDRYDAEAAQQAWEEARGFLAEVLL